jgi:hypothetical protein
MILGLLVINTLVLFFVCYMVWVIGDRQAKIHRDRLK